MDRHLVRNPGVRADRTRDFEAPGGSARTSEDFPEGHDGPLDDFDGLEPSVDEQAADLDDQPAHEIGLDIKIEELAGNLQPEPSSTPLDVGALLPAMPDTVMAADDDAPGLAEGDEPNGLVAPPDSPGEELDSSGDDGAAWMPALELPALDADDGDEPRQPWEFGPDARDEPLPPLARESWHERSLPFSSSPCQALALGLGVLVAAGRELLWWAGSAAEPRRAASQTGRVESLVLVGQTRQYALYSTAVGAVMRGSPEGKAERLEGWRAAAGVTMASMTRLELSQLGDDCPRLVLGRTSDGVLLRSRDGGVAWEKIVLPGRVHALSPRGSPVALLGEVGGDRVLWWSENGGDDFAELGLPAVARAVGDGQGPLIAASLHVVALADDAHGLVVSADCGRTFRKVAGCAHATALAAGELDGQATVFASLLVESEDRSELVVVDPERGEAWRVGSVRARGAGSEELDDSLEGARVNALGWDADSRCLWLAGNFGLTSWFPPRATDA